MLEIGSASNFAYPYDITYPHRLTSSEEYILLSFRGNVSYSPIKHYTKYEKLYAKIISKLHLQVLNKEGEIRYINRIPFINDSMMFFYGIEGKIIVNSGIIRFDTEKLLDEEKYEIWKFKDKNYNVYQWFKGFKNLKDETGIQSLVGLLPPIGAEVGFTNPDDLSNLNWFTVVGYDLNSQTKKISFQYEIKDKKIKSYYINPFANFNIPFRLNQTKVTTNIGCHEQQEGH